MKNLIARVNQSLILTCNRTAGLTEEDSTHGPWISNEASLPFHEVASILIGISGAWAKVPVHAARVSEICGMVSRGLAGVKRDASTPAAANTAAQSGGVVGSSARSSQRCGFAATKTS